jgi:hypothetical protein
LRHDVDRLPSRALQLARLEKELDVSSTYFFRVKGVSFHRPTIGKIAGLGHEIGYHYEDLSDAGGDAVRAIESFKQNLRKFDEFGGVSSIAMHGRPFSKWDNRDLWKDFDYRDYGPLVEAYRDVESSGFFYFTDVGRCWNSRSNQRDHLNRLAKEALDRQPAGTRDLIRFIAGRHADMIISTHPERWTDGPIGWLQVLVVDEAISLVKKAFLSRRGIGRAS